MKKSADYKWKKAHINKADRHVRFVDNIRALKGKDDNDKERRTHQAVNESRESLKIVPKRSLNEHNERESNKSAIDAIYVDNRCRYWIQQRIGDMMNSNAFTTKNGYVFAVDTDRYNGGLCFRFARNGTEVARIDSNGYLYCSNVWLNGVNVLSILNSIRDKVGDISTDLSLYVKHKQLKNGTYELNVKEIITTYLKVLNSSLTTNQTMDGLIFGKDTTKGNNSLLRFTYTGDNNANNSVSLGFKDYTDQYIFYRNRCKFLSPFVSDVRTTPAILCQNTANYVNANCAMFMSPNISSGNGSVIKLGRSNNQGNTSYLRYHWAGSDNANSYLAIGHYNYDDRFKFYRDRVDFSAPLIINYDTDKALMIKSNNNPAIYIGHDFSANNSLVIRYKHTTPQSLGVGFYGNEDILTMDTNKKILINDGMLAVMCSLASKVYQKLECSTSLNNNEYVRLQFNDTIKEAMIDLLKDSEGYKLHLKLADGSAGISVNESSIDLTGEVDISNDCHVGASLYTDNIYSNTQANIEVNNQLSLSSGLKLDDCPISQICTSTDYMNNQKIDNNALITSQAVNSAINTIPTPQDYFNTIDEGEWIHILPEAGYYCYALYSVTRDKFIIFRSDSALMYISPNGVDTWTSEDLPAEVDNDNIACLSLDDTLYYYNGLQLYKNTQMGAGWSSVSSPLRVDYPTLCSLNDFMVLAGGLSTTTTSVYRYNKSDSTWTGVTFERGARRFCAAGSDRVVTMESNTSTTQLSVRWSFNGYQWFGSSIAHLQHTSCFAYGNSGGVGCWVSGTYSEGGKCTCIWWDSPMANTPSYASFDKPADGDVESIIYNAGVWIMYINGEANYYYNRSPIPCYGTWEQASADNSHIDTRVFWCKDKFILLEPTTFTDEYVITHIDPIYQLNTTAALTASNLSVDNETRLSRLEAQMNNIMMLTLQTVYPIGSIYVSMNSTSPNLLFGFGTWTKITNRFLYCVDNGSGATGGEATHKLTEAEVPSKSWSWRGESYRLNNDGYTNVDATQYENTTRWDIATGSGTDYSVQKQFTMWYGGGNPHNNMPPYLTVYAWQRTA